MGRKCMKSRPYQILIEPDHDGDGKEFLDCLESMEELESTTKKLAESPIISLHVMIGTKGYQTMDLDWSVQDIAFTTDFFVIPLQGCDTLLGVQWLVTLGPIV
ncbi:hypothetical protein J1N35_018112 [Gossypium stocksii]|uniref:Uncharacterized protein n=1 Tax=Gossypium stocksii TaxID=47602 RepID=A0A9D3VQ67_9ROSI|nr:hypothetical protein J1N35_018112 [Gossypium stocksii]